MIRSPHTPLRTLAGIVLCLAAGSAVAQSPLTDAQARYMGAHVFERQVEVFRAYCAQDPQAAEQLERGIATFRVENPDFTAALDARPVDAEFAAGVAAFDARFEQIAGAMHQYLASEPPQTRCATIAGHLGDMRFAAMIEEATHSVADAVAADESAVDAVASEAVTAAVP